YTMPSLVTWQRSSCRRTSCFAYLDRPALSLATRSLWAAGYVVSNFHACFDWRPRTLVDGLHQHLRRAVPRTVSWPLVLRRSDLCRGSLDLVDHRRSGCLAHDARRVASVGVVCDWYGAQLRDDDRAQSARSISGDGAGRCTNRLVCGRCDRSSGLDCSLGTRRSKRGSLVVDGSCALLRIDVDRPS